MMSLNDLIKIIRKRWIFILIPVFLSGTATGLITWLFMEDIYEANAILIVSSQKNKQEDSSISYNDYALSVELVNSYQVLCKTNRILKQVIEETGLDLTTDQLAEKISVSAKADTEIIGIAVKDSDAAVAQNITNVLADVFEQEVARIMKMDNVQIIDYAELPQSPVSPNRVRNTALGLLIGLAAGIGLVIMIDLLDISIKSMEQIGQILEIPMLGMVPHIESSRSRKDTA